MLSTDRVNDSLQVKAPNFAMIDREVLETQGHKEDEQVLREEMMGYIREYVGNIPTSRNATQGESTVSNFENIARLHSALVDWADGGEQVSH